MIGTAGQLHRASDDTDATLDAIPKTLSLFEPRLLFALTLPGCQVTRLRDRKLLNARLTRAPFVGRREKAAIPGQHMRCVMEQALMLAECWQKPGLIGRIANGDDLPSNDQAAIHLGIIHLVTELRVVWWGFAPTDDLRVRLDKTHDFVSGRNTFTFQHTPFRLFNHLLDQRHQLAELLSQSLGGCRGRIA